MGKRLLSVFVFAAVLLLTGCFGGPVQDDIMNYINEEMEAARSLELQAITAYESVSGANYQDDPTMYDALTNEVIPTYTEFIDEIESVAIETEELEKIHDLYIEGAQSQFDGFLKVVEAIEKQDASIVDEANRLLSEGREKIEEYKRQLKALAKEHDVKLEEIN